MLICGNSEKYKLQDSALNFMIMNNLANLRGQFAAVLTRDEMKNVVGGVLPPLEDGPCLLAYRTRDGSNTWLGWSVKTYSVSQAQADYQSGAHVTVNGIEAYVSGYCCASC